MAQKIKTLLIALASVLALALMLEPAGVLAADFANGCAGDSSQAGAQKCLGHNAFIQDLNLIVNILSAGVGIICVAMIIVGGIQYSMAGDNASALTAAKQRITNAVIAMVAFVLIYAFLQWLIPGGAFS